MDAKRGYLKGLYTVVDGLDGIGKGEVERAIIGFEQKLGRTTFDSIAFSKANRKGLPEIGDFWRPPHVYFDTLIVAEPTYSGIGQVIREEMINAGNKGKYSAEDEIQAYSLDRKVQLQRVILPALNHGLRVLSSRCFASTLTYQQLRTQEEGGDIERTKRRILAHGGNKLQLENAPDLLIIPTIQDMGQLEARLADRAKMSKDDNSIFDSIKFQSRLKPLYESKWLRKLFEEVGTEVRYLDAGTSPEETRRQAVDIYKKFLSGKGLL